MLFDRGKVKGVISIIPYVVLNLQSCVVLVLRKIRPRRKFRYQKRKRITGKYYKNNDKNKEDLNVLIRKNR